MNPKLAPPTLLHATTLRRVSINGAIGLDRLRQPQPYRLKLNTVDEAIEFLYLFLLKYCFSHKQYSPPKT
jgi:hypothetical protein